MSLSHSPSVVTNGLILALDAANRKSYIGAAPASLINTDSWTVSSGSVAGYGQNGGTAENTRLFDTDPWGNQSIVWGTYASGDGGADGGWNTDYPAIDPTKLYRFSVWVRRTSATGAGTFYFGTGAGGAEVMGTSDSATKGNPYWECTGTSALTQNQWYLVCGHVYPHFTTYTGRHPNTGYFTIAGGTTKVMDVNGCNIGSDLKWNSASSSAVHRTYHYYCGDATTRLQFMAPRIDLCDGNEPSISELLTNGSSTWKDLSSNARTLTFVNPPATPYTSANRGSLVFNGSDNVIRTSTITLDLTSGVSMEMWFKSTDIQSRTQGYMSFSPGPQYINFYSAGTGALRWETWQSAGSLGGAFYSPATLLNNTWYHAVGTYASDGTAKLYINGVLANSAAYAATSYGSLTSTVRIGEYAGYLSGNIALSKMYNRALSATEIKQNFNALRGRYGL